jgi:hypothetical protein
MLDTVIGQWEEESKLGDIQTQKYPDAELPSRRGNAIKCVAYESKHSKPDKQFKFHITRLWIDQASGLAIRVEQLGFPQAAGQQPPVLEEYTYGDLQVNLPLANLDFDTRNPKYGFR